MIIRSQTKNKSRLKNFIILRETWQNEKLIGVPRLINSCAISLLWNLKNFIGFNRCNK